MTYSAEPLKERASEVARQGRAWMSEGDRQLLRDLVKEIERLEKLESLVNEAEYLWGDFKTELALVKWRNDALSGGSDE